MPRRKVKRFSDRLTKEPISLVTEETPGASNPDWWTRWLAIASLVLTLGQAVWNETISMRQTTRARHIANASALELAFSLNEYKNKVKFEPVNESLRSERKNSPPKFRLNGLTSGESKEAIVARLDACWHHLQLSEPIEPYLILDNVNTLLASRLAATQDSETVKVFESAISAMDLGRMAVIPAEMWRGTAVDEIRGSRAALSQPEAYAFMSEQTKALAESLGCEMHLPQTFSPSNKVLIFEEIDRHISDLQERYCRF